MKRSILIIFLTEEEQVAALAVASVCAQLGEGDCLLLLHNGADTRSFTNKYEGLTSVRYFESDENLGVAGGRNYLLRQPECQASELVFLIDSDAVVPNDYLDQMTDFMERVPDAGIAGPVMLRFPRLKDRLNSMDLGSPCPIETTSTGFFDVSTNTVRAILAGSLEEDDTDHIGTDPDWRKAYLSQQDYVDMIVQSTGPSNTDTYRAALRTNSRYREALAGEENAIEVANVAGACQIFRRELLDQIGFLCELYNPYGLEDVDFSVRALLAGRRNYTTNASYILHGTDERHAARVGLSGTYLRLQNDSRVRTIFEYRWAGSDFPAVSFRRLLSRSIVRTSGGVDGVADDMFIAVLFGIRSAIEQLVTVDGLDLKGALSATPSSLRALLSERSPYRKQPVALRESA